METLELLPAWATATEGEVTHPPEHAALTQHLPTFKSPHLRRPTVRRGLQLSLHLHVVTHCSLTPSSPPSQTTYYPPASNVVTIAPGSYRTADPGSKLPGLDRIYTTRDPSSGPRLRPFRRPRHADPQPKSCSQFHQQLARRNGSHSSSQVPSPKLSHQTQKLLMG